jgi:hypothetical protein
MCYTDRGRDSDAGVEAAERRIKRALLQAAEARDFDRVLTILRRWSTCPAADVLHAPGAAENSIEIHDGRGLAFGLRPAFRYSVDFVTPANSGSPPWHR